ncbi:MAG: MMPL family transporter [Ilumatobacter sp.]|uniref:efflux RND transporter permease subunit n=1 Tax=Ilumatobacter sp. TaxID=1967498 RepID=UPI00262953F7|nr:MMPL family transporter [Ilumatobacter sp.]MDJ0770133.1 MMPL family transporter [Ilumatobacter sp.]
MESFWRATGVQLGKHWKIVMGVVIVITAVLAIGLTRNDFATGQDSYLNPDSQIAIDNVEFQDNFGGETVILLFSAQEGNDVSDLYAGANLDELRRLNVELAGVDNVFSAITPLTSLTYSDALLSGAGQAALLAAPQRDEAGSAARGDNITMSLARRGLIPTEERFLDDAVGGVEPNPEYVDLLIFDNTGFEMVDGEPQPPADDADRGIRLSLASTFPNQQTAVGGVVLDGNLSLDDQSAATEDLLAILETASFEGFDFTVTGSPVYLKEINDYLQGGMLTLGAIAIVVMMVVLALMFRVRWRLLPLLAVLVGVVWTFSLLGLIGIDLSLVTISGLPILIGLGIDFAIQIHNRVEEEVVLDKEEHPIAETVANLAPPLIAATLAGVVAFLALQLSRVPMIRDFGVLLAIGVIILVAVGIVLPASILGIREWSAPTEKRGPSLVERVVVKLGGLPTRAGLGLLLLSVFLFVGGVLVEGRMKIESDPIKWIDQGSEVVKDVDRLEEETGFATTLGVVVKANNVFDQDVIDLIHDFTIAAEERELVVSSSSYVNTLGKIIKIPGATVIPPSEEDIVSASTDAASRTPAIARALAFPPPPEPLPDDYDPADYVPTAAQVNLRIAEAGLEERAVLVDDLKDDLDARIAALELDADSILLTDLPDGQDAVSATPAGLATVGVGLLENLSSNRAELTYLALSLAALFLLLRFRSLSRALLALVPVFLAVGASTMIVALIGIELSPLTTVSGPLVIATCTEFSVLIFGRYLEERESALEPRDASDTAAARTGRAFFTSAVTTIGGFAVLVASPLPLLRDFGLIVTLNVAIALFSALVLMPPMMVWVDTKGWLGTESQEDPSAAVKLAAPLPGDQTVAAGVGLVAFVGAVGAVYASADTGTGESSEVAFAAVPLPTTTTTSTTTTTTTTTTTVPAPTTTLGEGEEPPPSTESTAAPETTEPAGPAIDPAGFPDTAPETTFGPALHDLLTAEGVAGNAAHCTIVTAFERFEGGEAALVPLLLASDPAALDVVIQAGTDCGVDRTQLDAAIAAGTGG